MLPKWPCHFGSKIWDHAVHCDLKITLKHEVAKQPFDEVAFENNQEGERPWKVTDQVPGQERKVLHPKLQKATKLRGGGQGQEAHGGRGRLGP